MAGLLENPLTRVSQRAGVTEEVASLPHPPRQPRQDGEGSGVWGPTGGSGWESRTTAKLRLQAQEREHGFRVPGAGVQRGWLRQMDEYGLDMGSERLGGQGLCSPTALPWGGVWWGLCTTVDCSGRPPELRARSAGGQACDRQGPVAQAFCGQRGVWSG